MSSKRSFRADELAERLNGRIVGDGARELSGLSSLADAGPEDLTFFSDARYREELARTRAGALITREPIEELTATQILHEDPFLAFVELVDLFFPEQAPAPGIHPLAHVADSAKLSRGVSVSPFAFVGEGASIGADTRLHPGAHIGAGAEVGESCVIWNNVVIREGVKIGTRVIVHPGAIIGADGFGFARREGRFIKVRHVGTVVIEDDVEIGANATIDRGTLGVTIVRRGVKIDNLVHIAHNVHIGEDSAMAAQTGISGSTVVGRRVLMGGQVGMVDHVTIGDDAVLIAQSGVIGDVPERSTVSGYPARPHREVLKSTAELRGLSQLKQRIRDLEKKVRELTETDEQ